MAIALLQANHVPLIDALAVLFEEFLFEKLCSMAPVCNSSVHLRESIFATKLLSKDVPVQDVDFAGTFMEYPKLHHVSLHQFSW